MEYKGSFFLFVFLKRLVLVEKIIFCNKELYFRFKLSVLMLFFFLNLIRGDVVRLKLGFLKIVIFLF